MRQLVLSILTLDIKYQIIEKKLIPFEDGNNFEKMMTNDRIKNTFKILHVTG